ncbi:hypothetical protein N7497_001628 [Penicillium chrysogenum]|nr:hypothetical protein N7497_001628 [Penicillium chrysogenum]
MFTFATEITICFPGVDILLLPHSTHLQIQDPDCHYDADVVELNPHLSSLAKIEDKITNMPSTPQSQLLNSFLSLLGGVRITIPLGVFTSPGIA